MMYTLQLYAYADKVIFFLFKAGESLLMQAVSAGHLEIVSLLLEEGADIPYVNPVSFLIFLSLGQCVPYIKTILTICAVIFVVRWEHCASPCVAARACGYRATFGPRRKA